MYSCSVSSKLKHCRPGLSRGPPTVFPPSGLQL